MNFSLMSVLTVYACSWCWVLIIAWHIAFGSAFSVSNRPTTYTHGHGYLTMIAPKRRPNKSHLPRSTPHYSTSPEGKNIMTNFLFGRNFGNVGNSKLFNGIFNNLFGGIGNGDGNNGIGRKSIFGMVPNHSISYLFFIIT